MKRMFRIEFKRGLHSVNMYLGIVLLSVATFIGATEIIAFFREYGEIQREVRCISFLYQITYSKMFYYVLPVCCTFAMSGSYLEDLQTGIYKYILVRTTVRSYQWSKILNCIVYGILTIFLALILIFAGSIAVFPINSDEIIILHTLGREYYIPILTRVVLVFLNASFYSLLGAVLAVATNNRYMAYAAPFIFFYVIDTLFSAYLSEYPILNPREWLDATKLNPNICLIITILANVIMIFIYAWQMKRGEYSE